MPPVDNDGVFPDHELDRTPAENERMLKLGGASMPDQPSSADTPFDVADDVNEAELARVMRIVPLGAGVLAGTAVALIVLGYMLIYLLVFLPRGSVG
jgi:hypothetical protein